MIIPCHLEREDQTTFTPYFIYVHETACWEPYIFAMCTFVMNFYTRKMRFCCCSKLRILIERKLNDRKLSILHSQQTWSPTYIYMLAIDLWTLFVPIRWPTNLGRRQPQPFALKRKVWCHFLPILWTADVTRKKNILRSRRSMRRPLRSTDDLS